MNDTKCTYYLCPDSSCDLFYDISRRIPCESDCPKEAKKAIVCGSCQKVIELPYTHISWCRVDCPFCGASNYQRMSGMYRLERI